MTNPSRTRAKPAPKPRHLPQTAQAATVSALSLVILLPATQNAFVILDDGLYLGNVKALGGLTARGITFAFTSVSTLYWHPLAWLSHELDFTLFAADPFGHHLSSVLLHALAAGLLFLVLIRLGATGWLAAAGSLLWALDPLRVESFAWVAERKDVLCAFFFIATVLAYLWYAERRSAARYAAWNALGALALMSKPVAVCLVPILLLLDCWTWGRRVGLTRLLKEKLPLAGFTAAVMALTVYGQKVSGSMRHLADVPLSVRLENVPVSYFRYVGKILWPAGLSCFYAYNRHPNWPIAALCALGLCGITVPAAWQWRRRPWLIIGWLWFLVTLLPNIGLLQAGRQAIADRFTNLAMIGVAIAAVFAVNEWVGTSLMRKRVGAVSAWAVLAVMSVLTVRQIGFWHDSVSLAEHAISVEDGGYVRALLGETLMAEHRYAEAGPQLRMAVRFAPGHAEYHNNLANVLLQTGQIDQAAQEGAIALRLAPNDLLVVESMGQILFRQANYAGALQQLGRAVELGADRSVAAAAINDMGASVASRGKPREAEPLVRKAIDFDPSLAQARRNLVLILENEGRQDDAVKALQQAIQVTGSRPEYADLGRDLGIQGAPF